ncbi:MAG TPA: chloride channel protein [Gammaproteobacteria bacterium]|jgi:H+/Cl- antiporter ClcA|nr:chloride channel protein [Gammaproteobacteria bacterium]
MSNRLLGYLSVRDWKTRLVFWSGALGVGCLAALFTLGSNWVMGLHDRILMHSTWWTFLLSPLVMVMVAFLTRYVFPGTQGSGIPQAIAALRTGDDKLRKRLLSLRSATGKILMTLLGLLGGASIGREGPTIHVGASVMYSMGRFTRFPPHYVRHGLIMAGGAAGIAAAFNTPIAGIIFAIEEMARFYEERATGMLLIAVIIAGIVALAFMGNYSYFGESSAHFSQLRDWVAVPMCGAIGGLVGGTFSYLLVAGVRRLRPLTGKYWLLIAVSCGLGIAAIGFVSHGGSYGTGYEQARHVLTGDKEMGIGFPFYKMLATLTSYFSGIPGGIFSPSLSTGAGLGADLAPLMPYVPVGTVVLLGMVGYFTGVVQTPLTASVIVMEMVNDQSMVFPIMASAFIALGASKLICRTPIYWSLAEEFLTEDKPAKKE